MLLGVMVKLPKIIIQCEHGYKGLGYFELYNTKHNVHKLTLNFSTRFEDGIKLPLKYLLAEVLQFLRNEQNIVTKYMFVSS